MDGKMISAHIAPQQAFSILQSDFDCFIYIAEVLQCIPTLILSSHTVSILVLPLSPVGVF